MTLSHLKPQRVWKHFYSLTQIPRPSKHEGKAVQFLEKFGKDLGLETIKDKVGNIIIRKPATPGMENRMGIILQAHIDMVPQKNNDKVHDFKKDPIQPRIVSKEDGDWLYATGTTLGADNGLGCAVAMAVMEADDLVHGPVEALFTVDEETGMTGARELQPNVLKGDILVNLDSETEGELYVGCAGGLDATAVFKYKEEPLPKGYEVFAIHVKGLRGGHSGMEIHEGRGNANKVMMRVLLPALRDLKGKLVSIEGGNLRNAIPREAVAVIAVPEERADELQVIVDSVLAQVKNEYANIDPNIQIFLEEAKAKKVMASNVALKMAKAVYACPNGVDRMSLEMDDLVETSNNLAIVKSEDGKIFVKCLMRGSMDTAKEDLSEAIRAVFELAGAKVTLTGGYSGWQPNMRSPILKTMKETYFNLFGKEAKVTAVHAGLECGILGSKYPNWDMISCGPTILSPHSPDERVFIPSVDKWWEFIVAALANAPKK
ncbi:MAG: aminoacyl-histidine dipeptidase [Bacteroidales bacterium]|nr:aminoacyl-histidine dipeptidase [Bacteroidales bacterium]